MTVDEAPTIGTKLALGHGVSSMIAMLEPELKALDRTASSSAMLRTMTQLGGRLSPIQRQHGPDCRTFECSAIDRGQYGIITRERTEAEGDPHG